MTDQTIKKVAKYAPTTKEELVASRLLGEKIMDDYGDRLVKLIKQFVLTNDLQGYIDANRSSGKRTRLDDDDDDDSVSAKVSAVVVQSSSIVRAGKAKARKAIIESDEEDDEFATDDFDYGDIPIP